MPSQVFEVLRHTWMSCNDTLVQRHGLLIQFQSGLQFALIFQAIREIV